MRTRARRTKTKTRSDRRSTRTIYRLCQGLYVNLLATMLRRHRQRRPWLGATRSGRRAGADNNAGIVSLCGIMGKPGMKELPAAVAVDRVWSLLDLSTLAMPEGQTSALQAEPTTATKAMESPGRGGGSLERGRQVRKWMAWCETGYGPKCHGHRTQRA